MNWRRFLNRQRRDADLAQEIETHLAHDVEDLVARGFSPSDAEYMARKRLGNATSIRETIYDRSSVNWFDAVTRDLRYGARQLRLSPGFAVTAILTLALGIGANSAIFQLLDGVRLRSLPVSNPQDLVQLKVDGGNRGFGVTDGPYDATFPLWDQIRDHQPALAGVFAWRTGGFSYQAGSETREARGLTVSGGTFRVLGISPYRGRLFAAQDDRRGCGASSGVVLSYRMWQREFGGEETAIGRKLTIGSQPFEIIGITPPEFTGLEMGRSFDVAIPNCALALWGDALDNRSAWNVVVMGRRKPGWSLPRTADALKAVSNSWFRAVTPGEYDPKHIDVWNRFRLTAEPAGNGISDLRQQYEQSLWLLLGITGLVLLIACANLANLMLARAAAREREVAVRMALGASRGRLIGQLLSESLLLAGLGAALGAVAAGSLSRALVWFLKSADDGIALNLNPDWRVLAFTAAIAAVTCALFGLAPAIQSVRGDVASAMKNGGRGTTAGRRQFSFQRFLMTSQIAVSLVLLVGAHLFVRTFHNLVTLNPGYHLDGLADTWVNYSRLHPKKAELTPLRRAILDKVRSVPGITSVSTSSTIAIGGGEWVLEIRVPGHEATGQGWSHFTWVNPGYFRTMEIPILAGRDFNEHDVETSRKVLLVNQNFVKTKLGGANAIGATLYSLAEPGYPETLYEIIGVVGDTKYQDLRQPISPIAYAPDAQDPQLGNGMMIVTRSTAPEANLVALRKLLQSEWPALRFGRQRTLRKELDDSLVRERLLAWLSGAFGFLAVSVAAIGLYGVVSYMTARRRNEIGIRLALGSTRTGVAALVSRQLAVPLGCGIALGAALALLLAGTASSLLFGLDARDPLAVLMAAAMLIGIALLASMGPALRAARVSPASTLRQD